MNEKELQEKVVAYRLLESRMEGLAKQREAITAKLIEIQNTLNSMDEVEKSDKILFPLGAEAYVHGKIADKKKMIVEIGAGIAMEKNMEEAKEILNKRKDDIVKVLENIQKDMITISSKMDEVGADIQKSAEETEGNGSLESTEAG